MRIVSLLPAATEMVSLLGLDSQLVGRSHECDFPASILDRPVVTGSQIATELSSAQIDDAVRQQTDQGQPLYTIDQPKLHSLAPDLIITQALCDVCAIAPDQVEAAIAAIEPRPTVIQMSAGTIDEVFDDLLCIGRAADCLSRAEQEIERLRARLVTATRNPSTSSPCRVLFVEWLDPVFGAGHWNPELIERAGGQNALPIPAGKRSCVIPDEAIEQSEPDLIFVAACGLDAQRARQEWDALDEHRPIRRLHRHSRAKLSFADGNAYFNRPGPRLIDSLEILATAIDSARSA